MLYQLEEMKRVMHLLRVYSISRVEGMQQFELPISACLKSHFDTLDLILERINDVFVVIFFNEYPHGECSTQSQSQRVRACV